ncbi:unnamed protein product [Calicophoron daubneyi]|uniref:Reticulocalbin-3 n=1 Tax=Calicophoron daubneyi TaxID=300641 RepID=A0AAV2TZR8_CALDB
MSSMKVIIVCFVLLMRFGLITAKTEQSSNFGRGYHPDLPDIPVHSEHYDSEGNHDVTFDHELISGSHEDAETFKELEPEEAKARLSNLIEKMDTNKDGKIDKEELTEWIFSSLINLDLEDVRARLKDNDMNGDGVVTWDEYTSKTYGYSEAELKKLREEMGNETKTFLNTIEEEYLRFSCADLDKDGKLNETEYAAFEHPNNYRHMAPYEVIHTLRGYDKNKDGAIDEKEYMGDSELSGAQLQMERENFKKYDKDGDGKLDREEMASWVAPGFRVTAASETNHLFSVTDKNNDNILTKEEILNQHEMWVGSEATDYGRRLQRDEL